MFDRLGDTINQTSQMLRQHAGAFALPVLVYGAVGTAIDTDALMRPNGTQIPFFVIDLVTVLVQLWVTGQVLRLLGCKPQAVGKCYATAFGASLLSGLAIVIGLILLLLPGLYLVGRWSLIFPVIMNERTGVIDSMRRSLDLTAQTWGSALVCIIVPTALGFTPLLAPAFAPTAFEEVNALAIGVFAGAELFAGLAVCWSAVSLVILYDRALGSKRNATEIFG